MKEITLVNTKVKALVDDQDYESVKDFTWYLNQKKYAYVVQQGRCLFMHRWIAGAIAGQVVDHIDGNGLNNQRDNLRVCSQVENGANRGRNKNNKSGYKGVSFIGGRQLSKPWRANLRFNGVTKNLGNYTTPEEAAQAYNTAVLKYLDNHAYLNPV